MHFSVHYDAYSAGLIKERKKKKTKQSMIGLTTQSFVDTFWNATGNERHYIK